MAKKLVEALKRLRVIEKKMQKQNPSSITRYSSMVSTEKPLFETEEKQRKAVSSLVQSNMDLLQEYLSLKRQIEDTNLRTEVEIGGTKYTLSDLLIIKRKLAQIMVSTFKAMNDTEGQHRLSMARGSSPEGKTPHVVRFYKEEYRNEGLQKWQDLYDNIDSRLEVIVATTDLIE